MTAAMAMPGNTADTFLGHSFAFGPPALGESLTMIGKLQGHRQLQMMAGTPISRESRRM